MTTGRVDRHSRNLASHRCPRSARAPMPRLDALARTLAISTSRRRVLGATLAALLAPRVLAPYAAATQGEACP
jgi:hypothetical protein